MTASPTGEAIIAVFPHLLPLENVRKTSGNRRSVQRGTWLRLTRRITGYTPPSCRGKMQVRRGARGFLDGSVQRRTWPRENANATKYDVAFYRQKKLNPCLFGRGFIHIFSCKNAVTFYYPCLFELNFGLRSYAALWYLRIFSYLHSSHVKFIGLLPRFIFFVKVPFWRRDINHRSRTSFNKFFNRFRPLVGRLYVYVGVSPSFLVFIEVTTIIVVYLLFTYFPLLSFHGYAFSVHQGLFCPSLRFRLLLY